MLRASKPSPYGCDLSLLPLRIPPHHKADTAGNDTEFDESNVTS